MHVFFVNDTWHFFTIAWLHSQWLFNYAYHLLSKWDMAMTWFWIRARAYKCKRRFSMGKVDLCNFFSKENSERIWLRTSYAFTGRGSLCNVKFTKYFTYYSSDEFSSLIISDFRSNYFKISVRYMSKWKFPCPPIFLFQKSAKICKNFPNSVKKVGRLPCPSF